MYLRHDRGKAAPRGPLGLPARRGGLGSYLAERPALAPAGLAVITALVAVGTALVAGLSFRDPTGVFGERAMLLVGTAVAVLALDTLPRALRRARRRRTSPARTVLEVVRSRRVWPRAGLALLGIVSFYVTYISYRNLKGYLPAFVEQDLDQPLRELERAVFLGSDPATLLHGLLGTGGVAHVLSFFYLAFLTFVPVSVAVSLAWPHRTRAGLWYTTALGLNWVLGLVGYYLVPALGPVFVWPGLFEALPDTGVLGLQAAAKVGPDEYQGLGAFPSLHVSVVFTAALIASRLRLHALMRWSLWTFLAITVLATIYFGWHYVVDDLAGLAIGLFAVHAAALLTGQGGRRRADTPGAARTAGVAEREGAGHGGEDAELRSPEPAPVSEG